MEHKENRQAIETVNGVYYFRPVDLYFGRKVLDKETSKNNLFDAVDILERLNIRYAIAYGTLLGALREHDFIDWDEDVDICVFEEDRASIVNALWKFNDVGFDVARYESDLLSIIRGDDYIDLYFFRKTLFGNRISDDVLLRKPFCSLSGDIVFLGRRFSTVTHPEEFIRQTYGDNWMNPDPNAKGDTKRPIRKVKNYVRPLVPNFVMRQYRTFKARKQT